MEYWEESLFLKSSGDGWKSRFSLKSSGDGVANFYLLLYLILQNKAGSVLCLDLYWF